MCRAVPTILGAVTLAGVGVLLLWDAEPALFPVGAHALLGTFPLAMIAVVYLVYQAVQQPTLREWVKAVLLAAAFLFWAANQCLPDPRGAIVCNDIAIALFVLDIFLLIVGWPADRTDRSLGETCGCRCAGPEGGRDATDLSARGGRSRRTTLAQGMSGASSAQRADGTAVHLYDGRSCES